MLSHIDEISLDEINLIKNSIIETTNPMYIYLFGSFASNSHNYLSDIDIYVVLPNNINDIKNIKRKIRRNRRR